jgi:hypothetical protein
MLMMTWCSLFIVYMKFCVAYLETYICIQNFELLVLLGWSIR